MTPGRAIKTIGALACALTLTVATASAAAAPKKPEVRYAQIGVDQSNTANYRLEAGVDRAKSVVLKLRESPNQGEVTGPTETLDLVKDNPLDRSIWAVSIPRIREAPCYRGAVVAKNKQGIDKRVYRYCFFFQGETPTATLLKP